MKVYIVSHEESGEFIGHGLYETFTVTDGIYFSRPDAEKAAQENEFFCTVQEAEINPVVDVIQNPIGRFNRELNEWFYWCPGCNGHVDKGDKFCRHCGKQLDWEHGITELPYGR